VSALLLPVDLLPDSRSDLVCDTLPSVILRVGQTIADSTRVVMLARTSTISSRIALLSKSTDAPAANSLRALLSLSLNSRNSS
jgi:hypothetical protein